VQVRERQGQLQGPAFQDGRGNFLNPSKIEGHLVDHLQAIKESQPGVIPAEADCAEHFGISRSFRRGATCAARARGVSDRQVELINRWRKVEHAKGCHPNLPMIEHYSDIQALVPEMVKDRLLAWTPEPDRNVVLGSFPGRSRRNQGFLASDSREDLADGVGPLGVAYPVRKTCWVRLI
jgi:hypothetical protein